MCKMRRLALHLFTLCSAASLLVFVVGVVVALSTLTGRWDLMRTTSDRKYTLISSAGVTNWIVADRIPLDPPDKWILYRGAGETFSRRSTVAGFSRFAGTTGAWRSHYRGVQIPWYFVCLITSVLPVWQWARQRGRRRQSTRGLCSKCGYDLRASPERCHE